MKALRFMLVSLLLTLVGGGFESCGSNDSDLEGATEVTLLSGSVITESGKGGMLFTTGERLFLVKDGKVTQIPRKAAYDPDYSVKSIKIPKYFKYEGEVFVPTEINKRACEEFKYIEEVNMPNTITKIGELAFLRCENLKKINLSKELESLGNGTFQGCKMLEKIELPSKPYYIGNFVFAESGLKEIFLPNSINEIRHRAFEDCHNLKEVVFSNPVIKIDKTAFDGCENLDMSNLLDKME